MLLAISIVVLSRQNSDDVEMELLHLNAAETYFVFDIENF